MPNTGPVWTKNGLPIGRPLGAAAAAVSRSLAPGAALPKDAAAVAGEVDAATTRGILAPPAPKREATLMPPAMLRVR